VFTARYGLIHYIKPIGLFILKANFLEFDINKQLHNYLEITGSLNNVFSQQNILRKQE
jgi:hypothetical protein